MPEQPWSAFINVLILFILAAFLWQARSWASRAFIGALFIFEASHTWAHWTHMGRGMQQTVTHFLALAVNLSLIGLLHRVSGGTSSKSEAKRFWPGTWVWALWAALIVLDLWAFFMVGFVWSVLTQLLLFFSIFFAYYGSLPKWVQRLLWVLLLFSGIIYGVIWNEKHNCARMLEFCPWFPWHVMVESLSIVPITMLAWMFYRF
jgi:hypothetical protein